MYGVGGVGRGGMRLKQKTRKGEFRTSNPNHKGSVKIVFQVSTRERVEQEKIGGPLR